MYQWKKLGLIFEPLRDASTLNSYAALPVYYPLDNSLFRVYFASRDIDNRSHIHYAEFDIDDISRPLYVHKEPILLPGPLGFFDDHGVYPASIVKYQNKLYMYYIGWNPGKEEPLFYSSIGLAVSDDNGQTFKKYQSFPILARSEYDPCLVTSPFVMLDNDVWRMWYVSGFKWDRDSEGLHSYYHIKYAESKDGINWIRDGVVCIDFLKGEKNIARPCVIKDGEKYRMWFSASLGAEYYIGYAESMDGIHWERLDSSQMGMDIPVGPWDSRAQAYPNVFMLRGNTYMLYNGNQNGKDGFGLAVCL